MTEETTQAPRAATHEEVMKIALAAFELAWACRKARADRGMADTSWAKEAWDAIREKQA